MDSDNVSEILGKKIFFLYPSAIIQNEVAYELVQQEYEVYTIRDQTNLPKALALSPDSIVFINIDDGLPEKEWETWIRGIQGKPATAAVGIGILSSTANEALQKKYVNTLKVQCGFTVINKSDTLKSIKQIYTILQAENARGKRKYLRAASENETQATINMPHQGMFIKGVIKDISVVGLSCAFEGDPMLDKNSLCQDMQIKLQSVILKTEGFVFGSRMEGTEKDYVFLFTQRIDPEVRVKIRSYIQGMLQAKMDILIK
jgi:hypothetical protein